MRIRKAQPVRLGKLGALCLELTPGEDCPPAAWLVMSPLGRAVGFTLHSDPDLAKGVLATLRAVPIRRRGG